MTMTQRAVPLAGIQPPAVVATDLDLLRMPNAVFSEDGTR
jgi:hypothetical protein